MYRNMILKGQKTLAWYEHLKAATGKAGYALDKKVYAKDPSAYLGTLADAAAIIRYALTGRENSPDLYEVMQVMGEKRVKERLIDAAGGSEE